MDPRAKDAVSFVAYEVAMLAHAYRELLSLHTRTGPTEKEFVLEDPIDLDVAESSGDWRTPESFDEKEPSARQRIVMLECFLLHSRVLRDFFNGTKCGNDVQATHFFQHDASWNTDAEATSKRFSYLGSSKESRSYVRLNRALAHLSYDRIAFESDKVWRISEIFQEIAAAWAEFWDLLDVEQQEWFYGFAEREI